MNAGMSVLTNSISKRVILQNDKVHKQGEHSDIQNNSTFQIHVTIST